MANQSGTYRNGTRYWSFRIHQIDRRVPSSEKFQNRCTQEETGNCRINIETAETRLNGVMTSRAIAGVAGRFAIRRTSD